MSEHGTVESWDEGCRCVPCVNRHIEHVYEVGKAEVEAFVQAAIEATPVPETPPIPVDEEPE